VGRVRSGLSREHGAAADLIGWRCGVAFASEPPPAAALGVRAVRHDRRVTESRSVRVGLTGGIGSGKSSVARLLAAHGALIIDADAIAREVVEPGQPALAEIRDRFGERVIAEGRLDRAALAAIVFSDPEALQSLNAITHPRVQQRTEELIASHADAQVIVHDIPLLVEGGVERYDWDLIVVVDAPDELRLERLVRRGMTREDAERRMAAQATREERLAAADVVIDNAGPLADLEPQVDRLWSQLRAGSGNEPA